MEKFESFNPTRIDFGKGTIAKVAGLVPKDRPVLMTYGGGSIKRNGVYEQTKAAGKGFDV